MQPLNDKSRILEIVSGSHLYGTNIETSDKDYVGIFIPSYFDYLTTDGYIKELDLSIKTTPGKKSKNNADDIDRKFYSYFNYIQLATANNPNLLELLYTNPDNIVHKNWFGENLIKHRDLFPHKGLVKRFMGYAEQQCHKMEIKSDKYNEMLLILNYLEGCPPKKVLAELQYDNGFIKVLEECKTKEIKQDQLLKKVVRVHDDFLTIGDINIPMNVYVKNAMKRIKNRLSTATHRTELISKYGYDSKFGMHLVRLLLECRDYLKFGELIFPLKERGFLLDIRHGKYTAQEILKFKDELISEIKSLEPDSRLPEEPRIKEINRFVEQEMMDWISYV